MEKRPHETLAIYTAVSNRRRRAKRRSSGAAVLSVAVFAVVAIGLIAWASASAL